MSWQERTLRAATRLLLVHRVDACTAESHRIYIEYSTLVRYRCCASGSVAFNTIVHQLLSIRRGGSAMSVATRQTDQKYLATSGKCQRHVAACIDLSLSRYRTNVPGASFSSHHDDTLRLRSSIVSSPGFYGVLAYGSGTCLGWSASHGCCGLSMLGSPQTRAGSNEDGASCVGATVAVALGKVC